MINISFIKAGISSSIGKIRLPITFYCSLIVYEFSYETQLTDACIMSHIYKLIAKKIILIVLLNID